jgi:hypothetical protein
MHKTIYPILLGALLLMGCRKNDPLDSSPWSLQITDATGNTSFRGLDFRQANNRPGAYFDAQAGFGFNPNTGAAAVMSLSTSFRELNPQSTAFSGFALAISSKNSALLQRMNPATNSASDRLATLRQWLDGSTFNINGGENELSAVMFSDANKKTWQTYGLSTGRVTVGNVAPYDIAGYGPCLRASLRFTVEQMVQYGEAPSFNIVGSQNISGNAAVFFVLPN